MTQYVIYPNDDGGVNILVPAPEWLAEHSMEELIAKDVPQGKINRIVDESVFPAINFFRDSWRYTPSGAIVEDIDMAKQIAHDRRRQKAQDFFAPFDRIIQLNIPGQEQQRAEAEAQRVIIREKDATCQAGIDAGVDTAEIHQALLNFVYP